MLRLYCDIKASICCLNWWTDVDAKLWSILVTLERAMAFNKRRDVSCITSQAALNREYLIGTATLTTGQSRWYYHLWRPVPVRRSNWSSSNCRYLTGVRNGFDIRKSLILPHHVEWAIEMTVWTRLHHMWVRKYRLWKKSLNQYDFLSNTWMQFRYHPPICVACII